jgi:NAD-dependent epimerase/dehydratase family protein
VQHFASLRAALRPGHERRVVFRLNAGTGHIGGPILNRALTKLVHLWGTSSGEARVGMGFNDPDHVGVRASRAMHLEKRILVTGGSGFLGSHLCERLLAEGANVICVDNFFSGTRSNVEHLLDNKRFELMRHDVTFPLYIEVDQIYNLACPASPIHYPRDPV